MPRKLVDEGTQGMRKPWGPRADPSRDHGPTIGKIEFVKMSRVLTLPLSWYHVDLPTWKRGTVDAMIRISSMEEGRGVVTPG